MVWGLALIALASFLLAFASHSPGWMAVGILVGFVCGVSAALLFIDRHIRASARPEHMSPGEVSAVRGAVQKAHATRVAAPKLPKLPDR
ncbi:MAG TPA: hypothetical protein VF292_05500 [Rhodanobacteraceae bacterium]